MKKLTLLLILGVLPYGADAARTGQSTCEPETVVPQGYCCISYYEPNYVEKLWKCENLDLDAKSMALCKKGGEQCINFCYEYDLDNDTCSRHTIPDPCKGWVMVESEIYGTNCTIPNALYCEYERYCDLCGNNCYNENEEVTDCMDGYYNTEDWKQCLKCPGNGIVDYEAGNIGIAQCYIPRDTMTGSDSTGTFKYVNDKCYYKE